MEIELQLAFRARGGSRIFEGGGGGAGVEYGRAPKAPACERELLGGSGVSEMAFPAFRDNIGAQ